MINSELRLEEEPKPHKCSCGATPRFKYNGLLWVVECPNCFDSESGWSALGTINAWNKRVDKEGGLTMADILIRVEMPLSKTSKTELIVFPSGVVQVYDSRENYLGKAKAVPLPKGHGRMGDLDALQEEFKKSHDGKRLMLIDTAPTIIEADLEWKMKNCCCFSNTDQAEGGTENGA